MKTNYTVLILTFIINIFMALSLNSFTSPTLYLPMMFLYFLSGLAAFLDKISFYKSTKQKPEEWISWFSFSICFLGVCFYTANSLGFIEITFQCNCGIYNVLMQGVPNSFFTFNSINVTPAIFIFAFILPFAYLALCLVSYLRERGLTIVKVVYICKNRKLRLIGVITLSVLAGFLGMLACYLKYCNSASNYGSPQYYKYFIIVSILAVFILGIRFLLRHKNDDLLQGHYPENSSEKP